MSVVGLPFVETFQQILSNAYAFADSMKTGSVDRDEALSLLGNGKVFLPFRYGEGLAFAPAKFIGYCDNSVARYRPRVNLHHGRDGDRAVERILGKAIEHAALEKQWQNYCLLIGAKPAKYAHRFWVYQTVARAADRDLSAIDDVASSGIGNTDPEYHRRMVGRYVRDESVRRKVIQMADGVCEYCKEPGFETFGGGRFLEGHHVISLSEEGPDTIENVIALCPNDHRRAHFGTDWQSLQEKFLEIIHERSG